MIDLIILNTEIELKHIFLEPQHRQKKYSILAIAKLMEILASKYAPINPTITLTKLESIAIALKFYKYMNVFTRLCRIFE